MATVAHPAALSPAQARELFRTGEKPVHCRLVRGLHPGQSDLGTRRLGLRRAAVLPAQPQAVSGARRHGPRLLFWACGVTPQAALMASRPPFAVTHAPGYMLITDVRDTDHRVG
ncbi:predicted protein [Streptomyces viridochromogenes DSM 40736]|uniref:Predicted protein n=1 Tax=Streptomyces viridochromogenes (strain DSM 40736 / JCM 4977 / BCRC 1201 / Tue 494) TaxID=591159 RepID=D9X441_STRVT|nr:predicted protein [Streptomyces viridochromogenes DSM 40736]